MRARALTIGLTLALLAPLAAVADLQVCILRGVGGEPALEQRFQGWSGRLAEVLVSKCGIAPGHIRVYPGAGERDAANPLTRERAGTVFSELAGALRAEDTFLLVLIGHGSLRQESKFMVAGPDISASDFKTWLDALPTPRQVVINTASSSAAFINALSGPGRIICTSTHSGMEQNAPEFMEHLVRSLEEGRGDADRNGELTLAEWCNAAATATGQWYESEGFIATEHALLDDNGDGLGSRLPLEPGPVQGAAPDGTLASSLVLQASAVLATADPALAARYRAAIDAVKALAGQKATLDEAAYWTQLEALLLEAARLNREIHESPGPPEIPPPASQEPAPPAD